MLTAYIEDLKTHIKHLEIKTTISVMENTQDRIRVTYKFQGKRIANFKTYNRSYPK